MRHDGMERIYSIIEKRLEKDSFAEVEAYFQKQSQENETWFHLLMAIYFARVFELFPPYLSAGSEVSFTTRQRLMNQNRAWIGTLILHHLMLTMVRLSPGYVHTLPSAIRGLETSRKHWSRCCVGALTTLRVASLLTHSGFHVFFPSPEEDLFDKIDLLAVAKKGHLSACVQVKTDPLAQQIQLLRLEDQDWPKFSDYQKKFFRGVDAYGGREWLAIECDISWEAFEKGSLVPKNPIEMQRRVVLFVKSLATKK